jgi:hypothetical protein
MKDRLITIVMSVSATFGLQKVGNEPLKELQVDRLIVRDELIVSDTGRPWEDGFENEQIARGIYARPLGHGTGGLWVRGRLIKTEIDDPFDDRFHAINKDKSMFRAPGHISWNVFLDGAWRQLAIVQGEGLELFEVPLAQWNGSTHPGRLRFQSFRPGHQEPLTDALIGQGKMSLGGGGYGGEGLPYPSKVLQLWGGEMEQSRVLTPAAPTVVRDDGSGQHEYAIVAISPQGDRTPASPIVEARGLATLQWDSITGADAYIILRDGKPITDPLRIEGRQKQWSDDSSS